MTTRTTRPRVAIIGAGMSGISAAVQLQRHGIHTFTIFEESQEAGGTWWLNRYPGAEVDTPSSIYSFSFQRASWSRTHAQRDEIQQYLLDTVEEYGLRERIRFGTTVTDIVWDEDDASHQVHCADGTTERFQAVISGVGFLNVPNIPDWATTGDFQGDIYHSARWPEGLDLAGKRVAVVGTGSTSVQLVGELAQTVEHLTVFQRQPNWILPKNVVLLPEGERQRRARGWRYRWIRFKGFVASERGRIGGKQATAGTTSNLAAQRAAEEHLRTSLAGREDLIESLLPDYPFYGKRPVFNDTFYPALLRDNVRLAPALAKLSGDAAVDVEGKEHQVDVVVLATGFKAADYLHELTVRGRGGRTLAEAWDGEPEGFLGITVPGFPNFFIMYGPNTNAGPVPFFLECQARVAAQALRRLRRRGADLVDTRPALNRGYNAWVQKAIGKTVWGDTSSYFTSSTGRVVTQWPTGATQYWLATRLLSRVGLRTERVRPPSSAEHGSRSPRCG